MLVAKSGMDCLGQVIVMNRFVLELGTLVNKCMRDLTNHSTLSHKMNHLSSLISVNKVRSKESQIFVSFQCFAFGLSSLLNKRFFGFTVGKIVLNWANSDHRFNTVFLSELASGLQEIILVTCH